MKRQTPMPKHQTPNTRKTSRFKLLAPGSSPARCFGIWSLGFLWSLEFGFWSFQRL